MKHQISITFGDILDLLKRDATEVILNGQDGDNLTGSAGCSLWKTMEDRPVRSISPAEDGLEVWLDTEDRLPKK